jgi:hypothetical protein
MRERLRDLEYLLRGHDGEPKQWVPELPAGDEHVDVEQRHRRHRLR